MKILIVCLLIAGCASTKTISDYERANKAMYYRTVTEVAYKKLYYQHDELQKKCDAYQEIVNILQRRCGDINE